MPPSEGLRDKPLSGNWLHGTLLKSNIKLLTFFLKSSIMENDEVSKLIEKFEAAEKAAEEAKREKEQSKPDV